MLNVYFNFSRTVIVFDIVALCFHPRIPVSSLVDSWPSLLALLKDSVPLGLPAPGQFLILGLVFPPASFVTLFSVSILSVRMTVLLLHTVEVKVNHLWQMIPLHYLLSHTEHSPLFHPEF